MNPDWTTSTGSASTPKLIIPIATDPDEIKRYAQQYNRTNRNSFPICEHCNNVCYRSTHSTKYVCRKDKLNLCSTCYHNLESLSEFNNRRKCPNHEKCVAFESISDRRRYNNEEYQEDYFRDTTKCPIHEDLDLIDIPLDRPLCIICHADTAEIKIHKNLELRKDYQEAREWACIWAASKYGRKNQDGNFTFGYSQACGAFRDAFHVPDGPEIRAQKAWLKQIEQEHKLQQEELERTLCNQLAMCPMPEKKEQQFIEKVHEQWEVLRYQMHDDKFRNEDRKLICIGCLEIFTNDDHYIKSRHIICDGCKYDYRRKRKIEVWEMDDFTSEEREILYPIGPLVNKKIIKPEETITDITPTLKKKRLGQGAQKKLKQEKINKELNEWNQQLKESYKWK